MSPRNIAAAGILLLEAALAGCATETVENRSDLDSTVCNGAKWKPIGNRKAKVVLWGIVHNHARGKFDALLKLTNDFEIVGWVDDSASKAMRMRERSSADKARAGDCDRHASLAAGSDFTARNDESKTFPITVFILNFFVATRICTSCKSVAARSPSTIAQISSSDSAMTVNHTLYSCERT